MKYYKVVDNIDREVVINSEKINYSSTLNRFNEFAGFLQILSDFSLRDNIDFNTLIRVNNNIALWGNSYLQNLPKSKSGVFSVQTFSNKIEDRDKVVKESVLNQFIELIDKNGIKWFDEGFYLWEYLFEVIRSQNFQNKPSRINSFFLFETISDCEYYIKNHKNGGQICEVEIIETQALFDGDMNILDQLDINTTFNNAEEPINSYWKGGKTIVPIIETLFQGKCKLTPLNQ